MGNEAPVTLHTLSKKPNRTKGNNSKKLQKNPNQTKRNKTKKRMEKEEKGKKGKRIGLFFSQSLLLY